MSKFLPDYIDKLTAYSSAKSEKLTGTTWLNANENPYAQNITLSIDDLNRYPEPQPEAVIQRYAQYAKVETNQVLMTRGADEGIELLIRTFCESAKDSIAIFLPTYGMYKVSAQSHNIAINALSQESLQTSTISELASQIGDSKLVFICNPNNPTGALVTTKRLENLSDALPDNTILVVDEAYIEFCSEYDNSQLINTRKNVVILRTLSKAFALAGLRCGFTLAPTTILSAMKKVLAPYPVSSVVASIAKNALGNDSISSMRRQVVILNKLKQELIDWLKTSSHVSQVLSGEGNFVTLKLKNKQSMQVSSEMGLIMRPFTLFDSQHWLRISIGNNTELDQVKTWLESLNKIQSSKR
ncbi:histidinol-phosphate transaminase [Pseudoalteromonas denitrificans]|uniref:histidinol-phosphate transaminase n=1 Tax=Pseudoalteromonas denitrificans DSM 6059 TaxID=1123010 RepID=A0A1I1GS94_9GAMM|nr:histidinol-phosphate transaminase [Pseudoalteromonas denitrificans]SFC14689.1 histidinol-phosphate aminotransferase [Pseudoalteromonas denitrificans DSM 6059]